MSEEAHTATPARRSPHKKQQAAVMPVGNRPAAGSVITDKGITVDMYQMLKDMSDITARTGVLERGLEDHRREMRTTNEGHDRRFNDIDKHLLKQDLLLKEWQDRTDAKHSEMLKALDTGISAAVLQVRHDIEAEYAPQTLFVAKLEKERKDAAQLLLTQQAMEDANQAERDQTATVIRNFSISAFLLLAAGGVQRLSGAPAWSYFLALGLVGIWMAYATLFPHGWKHRKARRMPRTPATTTEVSP